MWDLSTTSQEADIPVTGHVTHIDVNGGQIMWATDEPLNAEQPELNVGVVHLCNTTNLTTVPVKVKSLRRISKLLTMPSEFDEGLTQSAAHNLNYYINSAPRICHTHIPCKCAISYPLQQMERHLS